MKYRIPKNTANVISIIRIFLTVGLWYLIYANNPLVFFYLSIAIFFTDILDGFVARRFKLESDLGRHLDTVGDAIFYPSLGIGTVYFFLDIVTANLLLVSMVAVSKLFGYLFILVKTKKIVALHLRSGQIWVYLLLLLVITAFLNNHQIWILNLMIFVGAIFSIEYILFCAAMTHPSQANLHSYISLRKVIAQEKKEKSLP